MLNLYLMASKGYLPPLLFRQEQGFNRVPKDSQHLLPNYELPDDVIRSSPLSMSPQQSDEPWKSIRGLFDNNHFVTIDPIVTKRVLIDIQDSSPNSTLSGFKSLISGLTEVERDGLDLFSLSDITGIPVTPDYKPYFPDMGQMDSQLVFPNPEFDSREPLTDFVGDLVQRSEMTVLEDGRVSLTGSRTEMKDILSILAEFYLAKNSANWGRQSTLVRQFNWLGYDERSYYGSALELETVIVAPPKSPVKVKVRPSPKKKVVRYKTTVKHRSNYSQACESLLSIIFNQNRSSKAAIPMLKKSRTELPNLLAQFSASIAGTGMAVLFSVLCKVASGRVLFCSSKVLNMGLGLGLLWLSWAVNGLRDTIVMISKNSNKRKGLKDDERMKKLDASVEEIYFRAAMLMAVMVLRLA